MPSFLRCLIAYLCYIKTRRFKFRTLLSHEISLRSGRIARCDRDDGRSRKSIQQMIDRNKSLGSGQRLEKAGKSKIDYKRVDTLLSCILCHAGSLEGVSTARAGRRAVVDEALIQ